MRRCVGIALMSGACVEQNPAWIASATGDSASESGSTDASASTFTTSSTTTEASTGDASITSDGSTTGSGRPHRVFFTSEHFVPDGGVAVADALCQTAADAQSLGGEFRAILSTSTMPAAARLVVAGPVHNLMGVLVADDAEDFWDGTLQAPVGYDELGNTNFGNAWTGTATDGNPATYNCEDWSVSTGGVLGRMGRPAATDASWIDFNNGVCTQSYSVFCLEQSAS